MCGYDNSFAGTLQSFFADNPGAIQAVVEWIGTQKNTDWKDHLDDLVGPAEENNEFDDIDDDGMPVGDVTGCEAADPYDIEYDR